MSSSPSHLPQLCLLNIFKRISLRNLCQVRLVCKNWNGLVPTELNKRRSLTLVQHFKEDEIKIGETINPFQEPFRSKLIDLVKREDGSPWLQVPIRPYDKFLFDALLAPGGVLTERSALSLRNTFASISRLTIVQHNSCPDSVLLSLTQTSRIITRYNDSLVSLKMDFSCTDQLFTGINHQTQMSDCSRELLRSINRISSLRHLTLNVTWPEWNNALVPEADLSILNQLDTFTSNASMSMFLYSIIKQKPANVRLNCLLRMGLQEMIELILRAGKLKFTSVQILADLRVNEHPDNLHLIATGMTSITCLTLEIESMPMTTITRCLAPLTELVYLQLGFVTIPQEEENQQDFVQLGSVRVLDMNAVTESHLDTERLHTAQLFPNIQVIYFDQAFASCPDCGLVDVERMIDFVELAPKERLAIEECKRLSQVPFRRCPLATIKFPESDPEVYAFIEDDDD